MTKSAVILSRATCPLVEIVAACRLCRLLPLSHASRRAATGRLSRFTPARGRSITTPSQHVRPALRAARPRFAALLSSCAQGSALLIFSASLCQYKCCALFLPQLAAHLSPLRRCLGALFLLRKHAPCFRPRRRSRICPRRTGKKCHPEAAGRRTPAVERQAAGAYAPTDEILQRFALQNDSSGVILSEAIPLRGTRGSRA